MRDVLRNLVLKLVGCPYIWGGANPWTGLDCSGFVIWVFQVFNVLPSGDWTAASLSEHFADLTGERVVGSEDLGDLVFYGPGGKISHVMLCLGHGLCVGASGGDHTTTTVEDARRRGAQVKVKPISYRPDRIVVRSTSTMFV
jgi:cell wall-associated NlpC family hydrolase